MASSPGNDKQVQRIEARARSRLPWGKKTRSALFAAFGIAVAILGLLVLDHLSSGISIHDVKRSIHAIPSSVLLIALFFTFVSFAAVALYDVVAVETIAPGRVPYHISAMAGGAGYAISNALGFSLLTGGALRYRVYAAEGIDIADIGRIIGTSWMAIWFAFTILIAIALVIDPSRIPWVVSFGPVVDQVIGIMVLVAVAGLLLWLSRRERTLRIGKLSVRLPSSQGAFLQILAGLVDVAAAAATLYVLLPAGSVNSIPAFALVYVVAVALGIISHAPGGIGAFEATIVAGLGLGQNPDAIAALVAYRVIYTLIPFLMAIAGFVISEVLRRRHLIAGPTISAVRMFEPLIPPLAAGIAFLGGIVLLISAVVPDLHHRLELLADILPMPFLEMSHLGASFVGLALLIVARGLARRLWRAWFVALILFSLGAIFALTKAFAWEEALMLALMAGTLLLFRDSFYRKPLGEHFSLSWGWLASVGTTAFAILWLGLFAYRHVEYANELWWEFAWDAQASRFLRVSVLILTFLAAITINTIINGVGRGRLRAQPIPELVPDIVAASPRASDALALLGDKRFLLDPKGTGFVMYARSGGSLVSMGEPVGSDDVIADLAWAFRGLADRTGTRTVFYGVGPERLPLFLDMGLTALKLGEVARVDLSDFSLEGSKRQPLRYAARRLEKEGISFEIISRGETPEIMEELRAVSDAWLEMKSGSEKRFSLGSFENAYLSHFDIAVLRKEGVIVAFANVWRGADKHEIAVDLMRYVPDASSVVMDGLFANLLMAAKNEGYHWFNLGAAPLSGLSDSHLASRWNRIGSFIYRRGAEFYRFDGLRAFKDKFGPNWTPYYLICPPGLATPRSLIDATNLVSGSPFEVFKR
ncbi:bifunctional lysylphosphatidylglycerol flippase/synthetase MprF [Phyllobacterium endophyticum]|uniref:Lysylphosphatidylglycerol synthetase n=1 Tax=Phyllobacterium endophyticum TaxID=1149773 RepID=A0A2P7AUD5_9HYPH|nr:bifunctional lysylphosphatidylglycerol flippase/synthetase MprF [Phyllobacterium endophyticum]MBB3234265.1 phosphatidylglycerol lysyltransferase [Phyllobacterium endophyticum]PSH57807.1 lysylphosphatidylglycerol synthetase [Phyllobacterium endophyticum]TYR44009.1 bifunctional lysylphosphatidylglycerol flippase/synthetase MprF [Phyllobacterium endophyticum]